MSCRYLGGVLDFTGELNRFAVARATVRDVKSVQRCRDIVDALMGEFLQVSKRSFKQVLRSLFSCSSVAV